MMTKGIDKNTRTGQKHSSSVSDSVCFHSLLMATRRARCAPKANVSASVRLGLTSLAEGNEDAIASMLSVAPTDDLVEKMIDCMGVNGLSAEMLIASYFGQNMLASYCVRRLNKSDKGSVPALAERIAREWAKPSFEPLSAHVGNKKRSSAEAAPDDEEDVAAKRVSALEEIKIKRARQAEQAAARVAATAAKAVAKEE